MTDDDTLSGIDLHAWRIPPPLPVDRASLLVRALSPAAMPAKRRIGWLLAAIVLVNAAIATLLVIVLARAPQTQVVVAPAGGGSVDDRVTEMLQRIEQQRHELAQQIAELDRLRALITELQDKLRDQEQLINRTVPKKIDPQPKRQLVDPEPPDHQLVDPYDNRGESDACDEVSCVLSNYDGKCCAKFKKPRPPTKVASALPESLDRDAISAGIAAVKTKALACGSQSTAKGVVKLRVFVGPDGHVVTVVVQTAPDRALGACVAAAIQEAVFRRTQKGGTFGYPFVF